MRALLPPSTLGVRLRIDIFREKRCRRRRGLRDSLRADTAHMADVRRERKRFIVEEQ